VAKLFVLKAGSELVDGILSIAREEKVKTARVEAIGGVRKLKVAYYNHASKKYEEHDYEEFLEVTSILGNLTQKEGKPFLHVHGTFGRKDTSLIGGHVLAAEVFPLLEVVVTPTSNLALRRFDDETGLSVIYKTEG
jgi:uncharacterized protein